MNKYWYFDIIHKYIKPGTQVYPFYIIHVNLVTAKALAIAQKLNLSAESLQFIEEASMLHDIGICGVEDEDFGTTGGPYITHGILGSEILRKEGYPKHAKVAENHTGVGLYKDQIVERNLPLPHKDFVPENLEERIISYADLFYSKVTEILWQEQSFEKIRAGVGKYGQKYSDILEAWIKEFES